MTTSLDPPRRHRVSAAAAALHGVLDEVADVALWSMGPEEVADAVVQLTTVAPRLEELRARVVHNADEVDITRSERSGIGATAC